MQSSSVGKVIDVRSPMSQAMTGRIPGAITVDPKNIRVDLVAVEPESEVIVYCACPNEYTAAKVAKVLVQHGFKRVRPLLGGIDAWVAAGHPVEKVEPAGAKVVPLKVQRSELRTHRHDKDAIQSSDAPAAIGPYSQAIRAGHTLYLSGQIPLDPSTMAIVEGGIEAQAHQVFRNLRAVAEAAGGTHRRHGEGVDPDGGSRRLREGQRHHGDATSPSRIRRARHIRSPHCRAAR